MLILFIHAQVQQTLSQFSDTTTQGQIEADTILSSTDGLQRDGSSLVGRLKARAKGRPICLLMDDIHGESVPLLLRVLQQIPKSTFWCAGAWPTTCPPEFTRKELSTSIRCPPSVQRVLQMVEPSQGGAQESLPSWTQFTYVTHSTEIDEQPLPTTGVRAKLMSHGGHQSPGILDCRECAEELAAYLKAELRVGEWMDL